MRFRMFAALAAVLISGHAVAYDAAKAPRYASPDMYRPNVDRIILNGPGSTGDVSGMSVLSGSELIAKSLAARFANQPVFVDAYRGGACAGATDDTCAVQAAINAAASGNGTVELPAATLTVTGLALPSNVRLSGKGQGVTRVKLKNGANTDVIVGQNAYALFGTNGTGGISNFEVSNLTIDGNRANNTSGSCLVIYGFKYRIHDVDLVQCPEHGYRGEWGLYGEAYTMEAYYQNIRIDTVGKIGASFNGPNDSSLTNITVVDASQLADSGYSGFYFGPNFTGRVVSIHPWHRSTAVNRMQYGLLDSSGGSNVTTSHFEGANVAPLYVAGTNSVYGDTNTYYSPWVTGGASILLTGSSNRIAGNILGSLYMSGQPARTGVYVGNAASNNIVDLLVLGSASAAVDISGGDAGYNNFKIRGSQSTGPGFLGSFAGTSSADLLMYGATSNGQILKDAATPTPASASAACVAGQRAWDASYEYRCVAANTWKRAALSSW